MILIRVRGMDVTSEIVREAAKSRSFDSTSIVYMGDYIAYRDAPNPTTQTVKDMRDSIISDLELSYPVTIETFTATEQHDIMVDYHTDRNGDLHLPDWYSQP